MTRRTDDPRDLARLLAFRHQSVIDQLRNRALLHAWNGRDPIHPRHRSIAPSLVDQDLRISLMLTLDRGAHASGWWRNSQYETCLHLSTVALTKERSPQYAEVPEVERRAWVFAIFGEDAPKCWNEPPAAEHDEYRCAPASRHTWHTRLFLDQQMRPIQPTGEVYTLVPFDDGTSPEKVFR